MPNQNSNLTCVAPGPQSRTGSSTGTIRTPRESQYGITKNEGHIALDSMYVAYICVLLGHHNDNVRIRFAVTKGKQIHIKEILEIAQSSCGPLTSSMADREGFHLLH